MFIIKDNKTKTLLNMSTNAASINKQIRRVTNRYNDAKLQFDSSDIAFCTWDKLNSANVDELERFAKIFKKMLKLSKQRKNLFTNGHITHEIPPPKKKKILTLEEYAIEMLKLNN